VLIVLISNIFNKKTNLFSSNEKFRNVLSTLIIGYVLTIKKYNENNLKSLNIELPSNFPNFLIQNESICFCNHNDKTTNSLTLLVSGLEIKDNFYSKELIKFCEITCLNSNSLNIKSSNLNQKDNLYLKNNNVRKREYSTLISSYISKKIKSEQKRLRNFSSFNYLNKVQDIDTNKEINYNKSIFSILSKIKELTKNNNYEPKKVQLSIENI
jgi:hypothetical protein